MAKIIRKGYQLEEEYCAIKQEQADKRARNIKMFCIVAFVFTIIYVAIIIFSVVADKFSDIFISLSVCLGFALMITIYMFFGNDIPKYADTDILLSGMHGERSAAKVLSTLPDNYIVFQNVMVTYGEKKSEIDNIVVGKSGVFIIEVKNHNSHIVGDVKDTYWIQHKVGRGGTPYTNKMYNPVC